LKCNLVDAVDEHIQKRLIPFKDFFPEHIDKIICGALANDLLVGYSIFTHKKIT